MGVVRLEQEEHVVPPAIHNSANNPSPILAANMSLLSYSPCLIVDVTEVLSQELISRKELGHGTDSTFSSTWAMDHCENSE